MYAALNEKSQLINAIECDNQEEYFCPKCTLPVKLVSTTATPFFRHENQRDNDVNEREIHKKGKALLIEAISKLGYSDVKTEVYLNKISQRPDILVADKIAVEFQCAKIDARKLAGRVTSYFRAGIDNYWILGGDYLDDSISKQHLKFISYNVNWGFHIIMLDTESEKITLFYEIRFMGPFNKICFRRKHFNYANLQYLFQFRPQLNSNKLTDITEYQIDRIRKINNGKTNIFKLQFFQKNEIKVEDYLMGKKIAMLKPIYRTHHWLIECGAVPKRLLQPLLDKKRS
ncbi:competence protein CoiA [Companilactobacillus ginsenosidimutans]|uniref:Competence protein CoiA nuclease-like domain-containing protein n=1 Tax=Companilactobacillus ginsenosidimutans TaxID=1007676 RepID=A0A0H4QM36_9LACO|nr:competence protein CoiA family protein [Companilactobacillus ginsenosidimutans]AKP68181.1 hypothetical protein ABM34_11980 [Companilactobacillus ginsenosidimutans]